MPCLMKRLALIREWYCDRLGAEAINKFLTPHNNNSLITFAIALQTSLIYQCEKSAVPGNGLSNPLLVKLCRQCVKIYAIKIAAAHHQQYAVVPVLRFQVICYLFALGKHFQVFAVKSPVNLLCRDFF